MKLILIRHGETENNAKNISTGRSDIGLTGRGKEQARQAGQSLLDQYIDIDTIYSSTLIRAQETASIIKSIIGSVGGDINLSELMIERDLGLQTNQPRQYWVNITKLPEEERIMEMDKLQVEPDESLDKRIKHFLEILDQSNKENILLIGHRGRFKRMLSKVLGKDLPEDSLKNGSITIVDL